MKKAFLFLLLLPVLCLSQTRLKHSTIVSNYPANTVPYTIPVNAGWNVTTSYPAAMMYEYNQNVAAFSTITSAATGGSSPRKIFITQFVTPSLIKQTINGTLNGQIKFLMSSVTGQTGQGFIYVRLINNNGSIVSELGTMTTTNLATTATNRTLSQLTLTNVNVTAGQRICIDIGWNYLTGTDPTTTGSIAVRNVLNNPDLPVDNTTTAAARNTWIEFSQKLIFQSSTYFF